MSITLSYVSGATPYRSLITLDTVETETPASRATSMIVTLAALVRGTDRRGRLAFTVTA